MNNSRRTKFVKLRIPAGIFERLHAALGYRSRQQTENYILTLAAEHAKELERDKRQELGKRVLVRKPNGEMRPAQGSQPAHVVGNDWKDGSACVRTSPGVAHRETTVQRSQAPGLKAEGAQGEPLALGPLK